PRRAPCPPVSVQRMRPRSALPARTLGSRANGPPAAKPTWLSRRASGSFAAARGPLPTGQVGASSAPGAAGNTPARVEGPELRDRAGALARVRGRLPMGYREGAEPHRAAASRAPPSLLGATDSVPWHPRVPDAPGPAPAVRDSQAAPDAGDPHVPLSPRPA